MKLQEIGEFGLIERIRERHSVDSKDLVGIGDDCAVIHRTNAPSQLLTTDLLIEDVHFLLNRISPRILGRKSMAVNISDIAAMGGQTQWALISIAIPKKLDVEFLDEFYTGIKEMCDCYGLQVLGGDTTASPSSLMISVTVGGSCRRDSILYRSGAGVGDLVFVSGSVGSSAAGLHLLLENVPASALDCWAELVAAHNDPQPEVAIGNAAAGSGMATAMIDVSDGVLADLKHICEESGVGAEIRMKHLPVTPACRAAAKLMGKDAMAWALGGGEDYRLIITVKSEYRSDFVRLIAKSCQREIYEIGVITDGPDLTVMNDAGKKINVGKRGWDHFSK